MHSSDLSDCQTGNAETRPILPALPRHPILPHLAAGILLFGMVGAVIAVSVWFPFEVTIFNQITGAILVLATVVALWMRSLGAWSPPPTIFGALLAIATVCGVPGLFSHSSPGASIGVMFFIAVAIRNYLCFVVLPRSSCAYDSRFENTVLIWMLAGSVAVMLGSLHAASGAGVSLYSSQRLVGEGNNWLNANTAGTYTALGLLVAMMAQFIPGWVRIAVACLSVYVLILTQSRGSMMAVLVAIAVNGVLILPRQRTRAVVLALAACGIAFVASTTLVDRLSGIGQIESLLERSSRTDPWSGRMPIWLDALDRIQESPVFGYGYMSEQSRFENGYLSLAVETGLLGFCASGALVALVLARTFTLLRQKRNPQFQDLARYMLCISAYILANALVEKVHPFQIAFSGSNAWAVLTGLVFVHSSRLAEHRPQTVGGTWTVDADAPSVGVL